MIKSTKISLFATLAASLLLTSIALASDPPAVAEAAPAAKPKPIALAPTSSGDDEMSKALLNKINKGSGDIVIRTGDLPAGPQVAEAKAAEVKPKTVKSAAKSAEKDVHHDVHWSYMDGPGGPENWGDLSKANLACSKGKTQSPININIDNAVKVDLPALEFAYRQSPLSIIDNGHTIMVNYGEGSNLMVDGRQFRLVQFHFHKPSEEAINGERMDMVVHLVHQHHDGALAVVGVLMTTKIPATARSKSLWGDDSKPQDNPLIQTLWNNVPLVRGRVESPGVMINVNQLLPEVKTYFTYMGSLTTPPCSENVLWFVMKNPILVSEEQVKNFGRIYPMNARPLQPKGDRLVKEAKLLQ
jgi:carbonic anhydrase